MPAGTAIAMVNGIIVPVMARPGRRRRSSDQVPEIGRLSNPAIAN